MKNKNKIKFFLLLFLAASFFAVQNARAEIVFEDNFDSTPDWNTNGQFNGECSLPSCSTAPNNWTNHYSNVTPSGPNNQTTVISSIPNSETDHTPSNAANKAYRAYFTNVYWSSGGGAELSKTLSRDYPELYMRVWVKTQPDFQMGANGVIGSTASVKLFRMSHYDRTGSAFNYFAQGTGAPMALLNIGRNEQYYPGDALNQFSYRCDPQGTVYQKCGGVYVDTIFGMPDRSRDGDFSFFMSPNASNISPFDAGGYADGKWHRYDMRVKMNSSASAADGIAQVWYDGNLIRDDRGVFWGQAGSDGISGWNTVQFGGNSNNSYSGSPQWIAYDDIVVSTTPIADTYTPGGGSVQPPTDPEQPTENDVSTSTINLGETNILADQNSGYLNTIMSQSATLAQSGVVQSLNVYVTQAAGKIKMGIYDNSGVNGSPGKKIAETAEITPINGWNNANVISPVTLQPGTYWLVNASNSNSLQIAVNSENIYYAYNYTYNGILPDTLSNSSDTGPGQASFYAILTPTDITPADTVAPVTSLNPDAGTFSSVQNVSLSVNEPATIYYTLDGSTPTESSQTYSSPLAITKNTTLKYFAKDAAGNKESLKVKTYVIEIPVTYSLTDVIMLFQNWLKPGTASDINADNVVNVVDLGIMMNKWR